MRNLPAVFAVIALTGCTQDQTLDASATQSHSIKKAISDHVTREIGAQWVSVALRIAKIESNYNPAAVNRRTHASGIMQVLPSSARALGIHDRLTSLEGGIRAGVAHMRACIQAGVKTDEQMARCHFSGIRGWRAKNGSTTSYAQKVRKARQ
jgi:membrane-bound lytic murein transglycosylase MltF